VTTISRFTSRTDDARTDDAQFAGPRVTLAWLVRAGSISHPSTAAFLAERRVPGGAMIRLEIACDASGVRARLVIGEHEHPLDELLGAEVSVRWTRDTDLTLDHVDAASSAGRVLRATLDATGAARYASTSLLAALGLPGGRYELTR
jgi:hypothetical protein